MTLSREEIAVRVNEALLAYVEAHGHSPGCDVSMFVGAEKCNCGYTELAYALRAILLTPTPAPGAPPAGPCPGEDARDDAEACKRIAAAGLAVPPPAPTPAPETKCDWCGGPHVRDVFHAADLQPPAPEAKRPTWVRYVKSGSDAVIARPVLRWEGANPVVPSSDGAKGLDHSYTFHLLPDEWVACDAPAPCPPPVAGRVEKDEAFKALLAYAECEEAAWGQNDEWEAVLMRHGMEKGAHPHEFLGTLRTKALALSRPVRP